MGLRFTFAGFQMDNPTAAVEEAMGVCLARFRPISNGRPYRGEMNLETLGLQPPVTVGLKPGATIQSPVIW